MVDEGDVSPEVALADDVGADRLGLEIDQVDQVALGQARDRLQEQPVERQVDHAGLDRRAAVDRLDAHDQAVVGLDAFELAIADRETMRGRRRV